MRDSKGRLMKGNVPWNYGVSMSKLYPHAGFQKGNKLGYISVDVAFRRILEEANKLEKDGFRVIPIGKVVPDIIAIKDNKVYAIEVETSNHPNYGKYDKNDYSKYFDGIRWIVRRRDKK